MNTMIRMRPIIPGFLVLAILAAAFSPVGSQVKDHTKIKFPPMREFEVPSPQRVQLDNGMVLMLMEDHELPLVEVIAEIRVGSRQEPADKTGLASVFGQVWRTGGTTTMSGDQIDDFLESRAAIIETGAGVDSAQASASALKEDFPEVLELFADILRNPIFDEDKITIAKNLENAAIARRNDDGQQIMRREFAKLVYGADSPYARTTEYATIANVDRSDLVGFHAENVHPNRIILGVVGDFRSDEMTVLLRETFADWTKGPDAPPVEAAYKEKPDPGIYFVAKEDMTQSNIMMGHLGIRRDNPDFFAVQVLNEAFGGSFAARLFANVRTDKGLAYAVRGAVGSDYDHPGAFAAWMTTKTETTAAGIDALVEEIDKIIGDAPATEAEVARAKESILASFVFNFDSKSEVLQQQMTYEYFGYPSDFLSRYRDSIEAVTAEDVARVARKYIRKEDLAIVVVGPSEGHDRPLSSFGEVATIDISIPDPPAPAIPEATPESLAEGKKAFDKVVDAMGGAAAVDEVDSVRLVANIALTLPQGMEISVKATSTVAWPDRLRQDLSTPMGQIVIVVDGDEGYANQMGQQKALSAEELAEAHQDLRRQPLFLARLRETPGFSVQHLGKESIDGRPAVALLASYEGDSTKLLVDADTGALLGQRYQGSDMTGTRGEILVRYSDYREVSGIMVPFESQEEFNGRLHRKTTSEVIEINPEVDAAIFAPPKPQAASAGD